MLTHTKKKILRCNNRCLRLANCLAHETTKSIISGVCVYLVCSIIYTKLQLHIVVSVFGKIRFWLDILKIGLGDPLNYPIYVHVTLQLSQEKRSLLL